MKGSLKVLCGETYHLDRYGTSVKGSHHGLETVEGLGV